MLKALSKRERTILFITIALILFSLFFKLFIEPLLNKNEELSSEIRLTQSRLKKYLLLLNQADYLKNAYAKISPGENTPQPGLDSSLNILAEIEKLAQGANLKIIDLRPQVQGNLSVQKESRLELHVEGDMESCLKFIYNIENSLLPLEVKKFQLSAKPGSSLLEGSFLITNSLTA